jgi:hypothetical protein
MSDFMRKVLFMLVLAGLLTWGVATMAQGPSTGTVSNSAIQLQGHVMDNGQPVSRDQIRPF